MSADQCSIHATEDVSITQLRHLPLILASKAINYYHEYVPRRIGSGWFVRPWTSRTIAFESTRLLAFNRLVSAHTAPEIMRGINRALFRRSCIVDLFMDSVWIWYVGDDFIANLRWNVWFTFSRTRFRLIVVYHLL